MRIIYFDIFGKLLAPPTVLRKYYRNHYVPTSSEKILRLSVLNKQTRQQKITMLSFKDASESVRPFYGQTTEVCRKTTTFCCHFLLIV